MQKLRVMMAERKHNGKSRWELTVWTISRRMSTHCGWCRAVQTSWYTSSWHTSWQHASSWHISSWPTSWRHAFSWHTSSWQTFSWHTYLLMTYLLKQATPPSTFQILPLTGETSQTYKPMAESGLYLVRV